jgi:hypothetical protein
MHYTKSRGKNAKNVLIFEEWELLSEQVVKAPDLRCQETEQVQGKGEVVPVHARKAHGGSRGIAALILNLSIKCTWVANVMTRLYYNHPHMPQDAT